MGDVLFVWTAQTDYQTCLVCASVLDLLSGLYPYILCLVYIRRLSILKMANEEEALVNVAGLGRLKPKKCLVEKENEVKSRKWNDEGTDLLINKMHAGSTSLSISRKLSLVIASFCGDLYLQL